MDRILALGLLLCCAAYVDFLPRTLGGSDEGIYLYEAKRLLRGDVFYRDIFDLITPGAHYLMAGAFALFGTSIDTARRADALVQGLIVLTTFASARMLGVRRTLAAAAGLAQVAVFQPAWPVASPHWLATLLGLLFFPVFLAPPTRPLAFVAGALAGLLVAVQQQKGVAMIAGAVAFLVAERVLVRREAGSRLAPFVAGVAVITLPLAACLVLSAGATPVLQALVLHPLFNYTHLNQPQARWGSIGIFPWYARYTFPAALAVVPGLTLVAGVRAAVAIARRDDGENLRRALLLPILGLASIAAIAYYPDYAHLAFVGSVFAILAAELAETAFRARLLAGRPATAVVLALLVATGAQLARVMIGSWRDFPFVYDSPFGRVRYHERHEVDVVERARAVIDQSASRELFVYPFGAAFYLLTGTDNPTPFQFLPAAYARPDQVALTIEILERRQVPYVIVIVPMSSSDPVLRYIAAHYARVEDGQGQLPLFRRSSEAH
jgi:hypothetical protein